MGLFDILEKETKRIEEEKSKNVATITEAEFLKASAEAVMECKTVEALVKDNPFVLLVFAYYACEISKTLFRKDDKKKTEGEPDENKEDK